MASIYVRNGIFQVRYFRNGQKKQASLKTSSKRDAERLKHELEQQLIKEDMLRESHHGAATVGNIADAYLKHAEVYYRKNGRPTSQLSLVDRVTKSLTFEQRYMLATDFGPLTFQKVRDSWIAANLSRKTCKSSFNLGLLSGTHLLNVS